MVFYFCALCNCKIHWFKVNLHTEQGLHKYESSWSFFQIYKNTSKLTCRKWKRLYLTIPNFSNTRFSLIFFCLIMSRYIFYYSRNIPVLARLQGRHGGNKSALVAIQLKSLNIKLIFIRPIFFITCGRTRYILHFWWDTFYEMHFKFKFQTRFMNFIRNLYIYL